MSFAKSATSFVSDADLEQRCPQLRRLAGKQFGTDSPSMEELRSLISAAIDQMAEAGDSMEATGLSEVFGLTPRSSRYSGLTERKGLAAEAMSIGHEQFNRRRYKPLLEQLATIVDAQAQRQQTFYNVPAMTDRIVGRATELEAIAEALQQQGGGDGNRRVRIVTISGAPAIGKTGLALEFARQHQADYQLIWYIPAHDETQLRAELEELRRHLAGESTDDEAPVVETLLSRADRWLLIFDNPTTNRRLAKSLPPFGNGDVLIASRDRERLMGERLELGPLTADDSAELMRHHDVAGDVEELVSTLGGHPLVVSQVARYMGSAGLSPEEFLSRLQTNEGRALTARSPAADEEPLLAEIVEESLRALMQQDGFLTAWLMYIISAGDYDHFPVGDMIPLWSRVRGRSLELTHFDVDKTVALLTSSSLATIERVGPVRFLHVHPMIRAAVRSTATPTNVIQLHEALLLHYTSRLSEALIATGEVHAEWLELVTPTVQERLSEALTAFDQFMATDDDLTTEERIVSLIEANAELISNEKLIVDVIGEELVAAFRDLDRLLVERVDVSPLATYLSGLVTDSAEPAVEASWAVGIQLATELGDVNRFLAVVRRQEVDPALTSAVEFLEEFAVHDAPPVSAVQIVRRATSGR